MMERLSKNKLLAEKRFVLIDTVSFDTCYDAYSNVQEAIEMEELEVYYVPILEVDGVYCATINYLKEKYDYFKEMNEENIKDIIYSIGEEYTKLFFRESSWEYFSYLFSSEQIIGTVGFSLIKAGDYYIDFEYREVYTFSKNKFNFIGFLDDLLNKKISYEDMDQVSVFKYINNKYIIKKNALERIKSNRKKPRKEIYDMINSEDDVAEYLPNLTEDDGLDCIFNEMCEDIDNTDNNELIERFLDYVKSFTLDQIKNIKVKSGSRAWKQQ